MDAKAKLTIAVMIITGAILLFAGYHINKSLINDEMPKDNIVSQEEIYE